MKTPAQIVVLRNHADTRTDEYKAMLRLAFEGSSGTPETPSTYLDGALDLQIRVVDPSKIPAGDELDVLVAGADLTVLVIVDTNADHLFDEAVSMRQAVGTEHVVHVNMPPMPSNPTIQAADQGHVEPAMLPVVTALRAMECARRSLQRVIDPDGSVPRLFISHAKRDGVPIAWSLVALLRQLRADDGDGGFDYFYDFDHIKSRQAWPKTIEDAARRSLLIILRTDDYETRDWCRREYLWAEANRMPILVIDMRTDAHHEGSLLPFDAAPVVRVHDGNVVRVVLHALATHLRALRMRHMAPPYCEVLPHKPSVYSIAGACDALVARGATSPGMIAYPSPPLPEQFTQAMRPLLSAGGRAPITLATYDEVAYGQERP